METHQDYRAMNGYVYGAVPLRTSADVPELLRMDATKPARVRMSTWAILQALLMPCGLFIGLLWASSFTLQWYHEGLTTFLLVAGFFIGFIFACRWWKLRNNVTASPWLLFLCLSFLGAWLAAVVLGSIIFDTYTQSYYKYQSLTVFTNVDPGDLPATKYLDAAAIYFKPGTVVNEAQSLGFKNSKLYCVAPIKSSNASSAPPASYDFWAVGYDCCVPNPPASFFCGSGVGDPTAHAALRWMNTPSQAQFLLGIQQAEAEYSYKAMNPLLFTWSADPVADIQALYYNAQTLFAGCVIVHAIFQAVAVSAMVWKCSCDLNGRSPF